VEAPNQAATLTNIRVLEFVPLELDSIRELRFNRTDNVGPHAGGRTGECKLHQDSLSIDGRVGLRTLDPGKQTGFIHIEFARARASIEGTPDATTVRPVLAFLAG